MNKEMSLPEHGHEPRLPLLERRGLLDQTTRIEGQVGNASSIPIHSHLESRTKNLLLLLH